jgi:predicted ribosomally synthesized peptide with nif11-like leader
MKAKELFLNKVQGDKEFAGKIFKADNSKEDVQNISKEAGIEVNFEEIEELKNHFMKVANQQEGELSDDNLEGVAGGGIIDINIGFGGW